MTQEEKAKAYDGALERARKIHSKIVNNELLGFPRQIEDIFPELRKEEKPLTLFQQCLNCILRGVYYAEVPDEKVNEFILNVVRTRTDELIKLAKRHEYTDCQLRESEDDRVRKWIASCIHRDVFNEEEHPMALKAIEWLEKQKEQKPAEWSEEDELMRTTVIQTLERFGGCGTTGMQIDWLKSLSERFNLEPKQEWSEEDERILNELLDHCNTENATWYNFLKSLRPSWKPSEEQMEALLWCTAHLGGADHRVLAELYEHLKMYCL